MTANTEVKLPYEFELPKEKGARLYCYEEFTEDNPNFFIGGWERKLFKEEGPVLVGEGLNDGVVKWLTERDIPYRLIQCDDENNEYRAIELPAESAQAFREEFL